MIEIGRRHYNDVRPHSSLNHQAPIQFKKMYKAESKTSRESTFQNPVGH